MHILVSKEKIPTPLEIKTEQDREELTLYILQETQNNKAFIVLIYLTYLSKLCLNMTCGSVGKKKSGLFSLILSKKFIITFVISTQAMGGSWIRLSSNIKKARKHRRLYFLVIGMPFMEKKGLLHCQQPKQKIAEQACAHSLGI